MTKDKDVLRPIDFPPDWVRPHLVLLGAGASYAAFPKGDRNGRKLPLMVNLVETLGMESLADKTGIEWRGRNFEDFYSDLFEDRSKEKFRREVEEFVFDYFAYLEIPDEPTIYDYLILSLRAKDIIATFNWDPFLIWTMMRNARFVRPPQFLFLHGNTAFAYTYKADGTLRLSPVRPNNKTLPSGWRRSPLLYPVKMKDYQTDPLTRQHWEWVAMGLKNAFVFSIFGYGAPSSDAEAVKLLQDAWGTADERNLEEIEIIDRPGMDEEDLRSRWDGFIHSHHYQVTGSFFDSMIARLPRRSVECTWGRVMEVQWIERATPPALGTVSLQDLQDWYRPLVEAERLHEEQAGGKRQ